MQIEDRQGESRGRIVLRGHHSRDQPSSVRPLATVADSSVAVTMLTSGTLRLRRPPVLLRSIRSLVCLQSFESYTVGCGGMSMGIIGILRVIGLHNNACNKMIPQNVALGSIAMYSSFRHVFLVFTRAASHRIIRRITVKAQL